MSRTLPCLLSIGLVSALACKPPTRNDKREDERVDPPDIEEQAPAEEPGPQFVSLGDGEVAPLVLEQVAKAGLAEREVLVYVGADWCAPCKRFHEAVEAGKLDERFPKLTLVEFDAEHDRDRLVAAGYGSRLVPLFAAPGPDGTDSGRRFEGSTKSPGAVEENIVPRLEKLLDMARADRASWAGKGQG